MCKNKHISRPPLKDGFTLLCIDCTESQDSVSFSRWLKWAGRKRGFRIRNLLSYLGPFRNGIPTKDPRKSKTKIYWPALLNNIPSNFPFNPMMLPMRFIQFPKIGGDFIMLPQGEVKGKENNLEDILLEDPSVTNTYDVKRNQASKNCKFIQHFVLAPGVLDPGNPNDARLDFSTINKNDKPVDFVYLSGHGGMSGSTCGEIDNMDFFRTINLVKKEFQDLAGDTLRIPPLWIIIAACFSLRQIHCELWARYFKKQNIPIRGILGYQLTAPPAKSCLGINKRFGIELGQGKSVIESWRNAHNTEELKKKWTALAVDYSKDDTLESLYKFKQNRTIESKGTLYFYDNDNFKVNGSKINVGKKIEIKPPVALMEMHNWIRSDSASISGVNLWTWKRFLITNIDFNKSIFENYLRKNPSSSLVQNSSWANCSGGHSIINLSSEEKELEDLLNFYPFIHNEIYQISLYPPFNSNFRNGFKKDDEINFSLIHVRRNYSKKTVNFKDIFRIILINGQTANLNVNYWLDKEEGSHKEDTIRIKAPIDNSCKPVKIALLFKPARVKRLYLWFWFGVVIRRASVKIFKYDFNSFTIAFEYDPEFYRGNPGRGFKDNLRHGSDPLPTR